MKNDSKDLHKRSAVLGSEAVMSNTSYDQGKSTKPSDAALREIRKLCTAQKDKIEEHEATISEQGATIEAQGRKIARLEGALIPNHTATKLARRWRVVLFLGGCVGTALGAMSYVTESERLAYVQ